MMRRNLFLGWLVCVMVMAFGCSGASVESMVNSIDADMQKMKQAAAADDENAFLSAASNMADTMGQLKPKVEKLPEADKEKYAKQLMTAMMSMMDPTVAAMVEKIKSGKNADKWTAIEAKMSKLR